MRRLALTLACAASLAGPAAAQTISARPGGELSALVGQPFDVPFVVDLTGRPELLGSFAMRISWDPAVLQFVAGMPGSFGSVTVSQDSLTLGIARLAGANPAGVGGAVSVAVVRFVPLAAATSPIDLDVTELFASGSFADLLPSVIEAGGVFCPAMGRYGDIDGDANINSRDALIALSNAVGLDVSAFNIALGDVDADGAANARDALIILSAAVGLDVSGFRVGATAGGACTGGVPVTLAIAPGALGDVVSGQLLRFEARATDAGGLLQTVTDVAWFSTDPAIVGISATGLAVARDSGTAEIVAVRDVRDTARVTVQVVNRRTTHIVASTAEGAVNRLGTAALPFATIGDAMRVAATGDTVQIRVGRYGDPATVPVAVLIRGDTLADGTRPLIAGSTSALVGLTMTGAGDVRLEHLAFEGWISAINVMGADRLELEGVRMAGPTNGVVAAPGLRALVVRNSRLSGAGRNSGGAGLSALAGLDTLRIEDSEIGDFDHGVDVGRFGYLDVRRSAFRDQDDAIVAGTGDTLQRSGDVFVEDSRFVRHEADVFDLRAVSNVLIRRTVVELMEEDPAFNIDFARTVRLIADTVVAVQRGTEPWLDVSYADSLIVDSLDARLLDADGFVDETPFVMVTRSTFRDVRGSALQADVNGPGGGRLVVDSVTVIGDPGCDRCGEAFETYQMRATFDRLTMFNVGYGIYSSGDSALSVTRSLFRHAYRPIQAFGNSNATGGLTVTQSTFRDFQDEAIDASGGAILVDSNTFDVGSGSGIRVSSAAPITVTRNRITADYGIDVDMDDSSRTAIVSDNVLAGMINNGMDMNGVSFPDTIQTRFEVQRNVVTCVPGVSGTAISVRFAHALVADNTMSCGNGIYVQAYTSGTSTLRRDSVLRNTITLQRYFSQHGAGIVLYDNLRSLIYGNTITGDSAVQGSFGGIVVSQVNCFPCFTVATIDSNLVQQTGGVAIYLNTADSVTVTRNRLLDVVLRAGSAALDMNGAFIRGHGRIYGNEIRRTRSGYGILAWNYDTALVVLDSNLLSDNLQGMYLDFGKISVTRNRIRLSALEAIQGGGTTGAITVTQNNLFQNGFGIRSFATLAATDNWWNDANGPACASGCTGGSGADSVQTTLVTYSPFATSEFAFTPPNLAPPALRPVARSGGFATAPIAARPPSRSEPPAAAAPPANAQDERRAAVRLRVERARAEREAARARHAEREATNRAQRRLAAEARP